METTKWLKENIASFSSVQFSCSLVSDSLQPHELQHARPSCPSPTPGVHSNSRPSSRWCHPAISSFVVPFSSCPQSLPASESFPMSQLFTWSGQSTGVSALASVLPKKHPGLISFRMHWLDLLAVHGTLKSLLQRHSSKASILRQISLNLKCYICFVHGSENAKMNDQIHALNELLQLGQRLA